MIKLSLKISCQLVQSVEKLLEVVNVWNDDDEVVGDVDVDQLLDGRLQDLDNVHFRIALKSCH